MEKRKKDKEVHESKFFKKKSKAHLVVCRSPERYLQMGKQALEQTKENFSGKQVIRRSASSGKKQKQNLDKTASMTTFHTKSAFQNTRYLTETLPTKQSKEHHKKLVKSSLISPQRMTFQDVFARQTKDRLSLNDNKKLKNPQSTTKKGSSTLCEQLSMKELTGVHKDIQNAIKRTCMKDSISKKDFLKITNEYQKLINRIVFSEMVDHDNKPKDTSNEEEEQSLTFRVQKNVPKEICPGLQLQNIKKMKIDDYQDEFMAHYDELSESWKRDIAVQRRF